VSRGDSAREVPALKLVFQGKIAQIANLILNARRNEVPLSHNSEFPLELAGGIAGTNNHGC
jgi:hypothetical protein